MTKTFGLAVVVGWGLDVVVWVGLAVVVGFGLDVVVGVDLVVVVVSLTVVVGAVVVGLALVEVEGGFTGVGVSSFVGTGVGEGSGIVGLKDVVEIGDGVVEVVVIEDVVGLGEEVVV